MPSVDKSINKFEVNTIVQTKNPIIEYWTPEIWHDKLQTSYFFSQSRRIRLVLQNKHTPQMNNSQISISNHGNNTNTITNTNNTFVQSEDSFQQVPACILKLMSLSKGRPPNRRILSSHLFYSYIYHLSVTCPTWTYTIYNPILWINVWMVYASDKEEFIGM